jgi:hypothetical protein
MLSTSGKSSYYLHILCSTLPSICRHITSAVALARCCYYAVGGEFYRDSDTHQSLAHPLSFDDGDCITVSEERGKGPVEQNNTH